MRTEVLRELWRITEMRNGAVYKTKYEKDVWVEFPAEGQPVPPAGYLYVTKSDPNIQTIRSGYVVN